MLSVSDQPPTYHRRRLHIFDESLHDLEGRDKFLARFRVFAQVFQSELRLNSVLMG